MIRNERIIGQEINGYILRRPIGEGGFGQVFLATDTHDDGPVAFKLLKPHVNPMEIDTETREIGKVHNTYNVPFLGHGLATLQVEIIDDQGGRFEQTEHRPYIVFWYAEKGTLKDLIEYNNARGLFASPDEIKRYTRHAAEGLHAAHLLEKVHKDIKPGNLFLGYDSYGEDILRVGDWGNIGKMHDGTPDDTLVHYIGTPDYSAPEHRNGMPVSGSDLFALALAMREFTTGQGPKVADPFSLVPRDENKYVRDQLEEPFAKALTEDPGIRSLFYPTVPDFAADVTDAVGRGKAMAARTVIDLKAGQEEKITQDESQAVRDEIRANRTRMAAEALAFQVRLAAIKKEIAVGEAQEGQVTGRVQRLRHEAAQLELKLNRSADHLQNRGLMIRDADQLLAEKGEALQDLDQRGQAATERVAGLEDRASGLDAEVAGKEIHLGELDNAITGRTNQLAEVIDAKNVAEKNLTQTTEEEQRARERSTGLDEDIANKQEHLDGLTAEEQSAQERVNGLGAQEEEAKARVERLGDEEEAVKERLTAQERAEQRRIARLKEDEQASLTRREKMAKARGYIPPLTRRNFLSAALSSTALVTASGAGVWGAWNLGGLARDAIFSHTTEKPSPADKEKAEREELLAISRKGIEYWQKEGQVSHAGSTAAWIGDAATARKGIEYCQKRGDDGFAGYIAVLIGDTVTARKGIEYYQKRGDDGPAGSIAALLGDTVIARKGIEYYQKRGDDGNAGYIAALIGDTAIARKGIEYYQKAGWGDPEQIAALLGDTVIARKGIEYYQKAGNDGSAGEIAARLIWALNKKRGN